MDKYKFGTYLKEARIKKNYTQQEVANLLFVDVSTVSKWERGVSYPDITLVADICKTLDISEHELIDSSHDVEYRKMKKEANRYNNMKNGAFWTINIGYLVAILTCFIVNISVNHTLSWFFIVLTSIICSYMFCPTITWLFTKYKIISFITSTFVSIFFLFLTCSIYTSNYWFVIATLGVILAYFIVFYPILFKGQKKYLTEEKNHRLSKWFLFGYVIGMFILISLLLISIYIYRPFNLKMGLLINGGIFMIPIILGILNVFELGKKLNGTILLSCAGLVIILFALSIGRALYFKSTETSRIYNIQGSYNDIRIVGKNVDIDIYLSETNENKVVYVENKKVVFDTKVENGILTISETDTRKFYDKLFDISSLKIELYLTQELVNSLVVDASTGDINIDYKFTFTDVEINNSTGNILFKSNVSNNLTITNTTGNIKIENSNVSNRMYLKTKTGNININNVNCNKLDIGISTGSTKLINTIVTEDFNMTGSTGDVIFDGFDAKNIYVTISTGNVKGTILSSKIFIAKSNTGNVDVPETFEGGKCKITTSTGDIEINYK